MIWLAELKPVYFHDDGDEDTPLGMLVRDSEVRKDSQCVSATGRAPRTCTSQARSQGMCECLIFSWNHGLDACIWHLHRA